MSLVKRFLVFSALEPATLVISFLPKTCREYSFNCFFLAKMKDSPQISNEICCMIHLLFFLSSYVIRMQELGLVVGVFHRVALHEAEQHMAFGCPVPDIFVLRVMFCFGRAW